MPRRSGPSARDCGIGKSELAKGKQMNKSDIAERMAERMGVSKAPATDAVESVFEPSGDATLRGEEVRITGSGTFASRYRPALTGRNPRGRKSPSLAASILSNFRPAKRLKNAVNDDNALCHFFAWSSGTSNAHGGFNLPIGRSCSTLRPDQRNQLESKHFSHGTKAHHIFGEGTP